MRAQIGLIPIQATKRPFCYMRPYPPDPIHDLCSLPDCQSSGNYFTYRSLQNIKNLFQRINTLRSDLLLNTQLSRAFPPDQNGMDMFVPLWYQLQKKSHIGGPAQKRFSMIHRGRQIGLKRDFIVVWVSTSVSYLKIDLLYGLLHRSLRGLFCFMGPQWVPTSISL